jgi:hypothetical protein
MVRYGRSVDYMREKRIVIGERDRPTVTYLSKTSRI